ncbi:phosphatidylserine/phosphatidylglycerophosphate/cardiolipin synthase-like enzyme [Actinomadura coerulea]|uniref:Phosphatidylserine/phosphatidylglycerophosphate/ cardiolipin synthase-like enzyme n=1 Tax=Actinomadura coerulea TaxID=46159 RepID=A0A7X0G530_9ACTN|nr:hypothetical protein [Actinomadura coerulea]MBB6398887.1 phosphatidylserine/phosphatidylglycerophosphate/cardiolipin synthase-like enzyme [Actinomadura coerulea]GGP98509.1 hypothetical protein GCM10010187_12660 [Actinomadura coerulea]
MSGVVTVYVPCDVVTIVVRMGYGDSLSAMEELTLRAVHAGLAEPDQLAERLGLGIRLVHDLVYDLWRQGHLAINTETTPLTLTVSDTVARCLDADRTEELRGAESVFEPRELMIDKLTMRVLPAMGRLKPSRARLAVPVESRAVSLADVPQSAVMKALHESLRKEQKAQSVVVDRTRGPVVGHRARRALSYRLPPPDLRKAAGRRWIELKVAPHWDEELQHLSVTVVDDRLSAELRQEASERLTQLVADSPTSALGTELREHAQGAMVDPPSPASALQRLERRISGAADIPAGQRRNWHLELADDARQLEGLLQAQVQRETSAHIITGEEQERLLPLLIGRAETQLVIVSPWIRYRALKPLLDPLADRIRRGVRVVFAWGVDPDTEFSEAFDDQTRNALEDLARAAPGEHVQQVLLPMTSARTHAKLLVVDDHTALVTSRNLLSSTGSLSELGVVLEAGEGESPVITDLLGWVRAAIPSYEQSRRVYVRPSEFAAARSASGAVRPGGAGPGPGASRGTSPSERARPDAPPSAADIEAPREDATDAAVEVTSLRLWTKAWTDHVQRSRAFLESRTLPSVRTVTDAAHRGLLRTALIKAARRVVIASHGLSADAVDTGLIGALRSCLDRGVEVTLVYGDGRRLTGPDRHRWEIANAHLEDLRREYPGTLRLISGGHHAKVLVWDDEALVGSFNYLSFEGRYGRQRLASELSVRLTGGDIADAVAGAVGAAPLVRTEQSASRPVAPASAGAAFNAAQHLLKSHQDGDADAAVLVRGVLAGAEDPWHVLEALGEEPDAPPALVTLVAARCLTDHAGSGGDGERSLRWRRWLIDRLWRKGDFVEAAVLRQTLPDPRLRPRPALAMLAAARRTPAFVPALEDLAMDDPDAGECVVGVLAAAGAVILEGSSSAAEVLDLLATEVEGIWEELAARTAEYQAVPGSQPITRSTLRAALQESELDQERADAWATLERLVDHAQSTTFDNTISTRTHRALFDSASGEFAVLAKRVRERSPEVLRAWSAELPTRNMAQLVQNVGASVALGRPPMHGSHLKRYVKRLDPILAQVDTVLRLCRDDKEPGAGAALPEEALKLSQWLVDSWSAFTERAGEMPAPEGRLVRAFLDDLEELARWGTTR